MSLHTSLYLEDRNGCSNSMCRCLGTDMTLRHTGLRHQKKENCFVFFILGSNLIHSKEHQKRSITLKIAFRYGTYEPSYRTSGTF